MRQLKVCKLQIKKVESIFGNLWSLYSTINVDISIKVDTYVCMYIRCVHTSVNDLDMCMDIHMYDVCSTYLYTSVDNTLCI